MTESEAREIVEKYEALLLSAVTPWPGSGGRDRALNGHRLTVIDGRPKLLDLDVEIENGCGDYYIGSRVNDWKPLPWAD